MAKVIVGQEEVITQMLTAFFAGGHILLEGAPGLAKTLMVRTLAEVTDVQFDRIQFTPDLMPTDITGTEILKTNPETGQRFFEFVKGPLFTNILLADEINRTPPKTQAALLEAMQEKEVTYAGKNYKIKSPFFIAATQNPIEQAGTFPLPEAQLDRFLLYVKVGYPTEEEEQSILESTTGTTSTELKAQLSQEEVLQIQQLVREVFFEPELIQYVNRLVRQTRPEISEIDIIKNKVEWGRTGHYFDKPMLYCREDMQSRWKI